MPDGGDEQEDDKPRAPSVKMQYPRSKKPHTAKKTMVEDVHLPPLAPELENLGTQISKRYFLTFVQVLSDNNGIYRFTIKKEWRQLKRPYHHHGQCP